MRVGIAVLLLLAAARSCPGGESVTVPWPEFRQLYRESLRREILGESSAELARPVHTVEDVVYRLKIGPRSAVLQAVVTGRHLSGRPAAVRLFGNDVVVSRIESVKGGTLVSGGGGFGLLPGGPGEFQASLSLLVPVLRDEQSRYISFSAPGALKSSMDVELPEGVQLVESPGIADAQGRLHFSSVERIVLRFEKREALRPEKVVEVDVLTRLELRGDRIGLVAHFLPSRVVGAPLLLRLPAGASLSGSSLARSALTRLDDGALRLSPAAGAEESFWVSCTLPVPNGYGRMSLELMKLEGNTGREGYLVVNEPDDADLTVGGEGLLSGVPGSRLPPGLRSRLGATGSCWLLPRGRSLDVTVRRFHAVDAPEVVVDSVEFFTAFEENGGALSVLRFTVPAGSGRRLRVESVDGAQVWSLKVNGQNKTVYGNREEGWILPLAREEESRVELAFLRKGEKLGLRGRLEVRLPATSLSARRLLFAVALPGRVQLISAEGQVSPVRGWGGQPPAEFIGKRYYFARSFHKGGALKVALYYREPVGDDGRSGGGEEDLQ